MASEGGALLESLVGVAGEKRAAAGLSQGGGGSKRPMLRRQEEEHHRPLDDDEVFGPADGGEARQSCEGHEECCTVLRSPVKCILNISRYEGMNMKVMLMRSEKAVVI